MKVLHIITCLGRGGAETMLYKLVRALPSEQGFEHVVISLTDGNEFDFAGLGVPVMSLGLKRGAASLLALWQLRRMIRSVAPDVVQGWMYHSNIAASLAAPAGIPVTWGIHHSLQDIAGEKPLTRLLIRAGSRLSRLARRIVYCSEVSMRQHEALGYSTARSQFIANGFECDIFRPDPDAAHGMRAELGLPADSVLVGHAARFHPIKNHAGLLEAFAGTARCCPNAYLLLAGAEVTRDNFALASAVDQTGVADRILLLGQRDDMPHFYSALDVFVLSSLSEGFPNVLGEAMACGTPCVSTDVGDAASMIGANGAVVPVDDAACLSAAIASLISLPEARRRALGLAARASVLDRFSLSGIANAYAQVYSDATRATRGGR